MNVVLIGGQEIPGIGGQEAYMMNLAKELCKQGHYVTIISSGRKPYETTIEDVRIIHKVCPRTNIIALPLLFFKSIWYIIKNRKEIDAVNYQSIFLAFIPGWIAKICGCKPCYTIHSLAEDNPKHNNFIKLLMKLVAFISIWCCGNNTTTISKSKAEEIKKRYKKDCAIIPCGINAKNDFIETDILEKFGIKKGKYFLTIGRIDPVKKLDILIKAFIKFNSKDKQLVLGGNCDNKYGSYLKELANSNIIFTGPVVGDDKETLLKNCYANCLVSSSEGMPISLLEAIIHSKPCIVTDIPAIKEIIEEKSGYWCKVGDIDSICEQMYNMDNEYQDAKENATELKKYIETNYTWDKVAKKYIDYLHSIGVK